jgi:hypothetical protein
VALSEYRKGERVQYRNSLTGIVYRGFTVAETISSKASTVLLSCKEAANFSDETIIVPMECVAPDPDFRAKVVPDTMPSQAQARDANLIAWFRGSGWSVPSPPPKTVPDAPGLPKFVTMKKDIYGPSSSSSAYAYDLPLLKDNGDYVFDGGDRLSVVSRVCSAVPHFAEVWCSLTNQYKRVSQYFLGVMLPGGSRTYYILEDLTVEVV